MASYRFGTIEVRPAERRVLVEGAPATLGARAFDLLVALIENRERVVSKDELLALVWPGLVVEENNLQVQVSTLRKILGGEAISTLPGRGYRFTLAPDGGGEPAQAAPNRAHNLPAELNSFVGRQPEIADIGRLLRDSRLVTLTGVGGTGKTRLSLHVATRALPHHEDGAWLVELAPVADERHVALAVASVFGITEAELDAHVAGRDMLIVLDNCEHLLLGCAELVRRLLQAGPRVRVLATSREPIHLPGEATFRVPPLDSGDAIQLFTERARAADPSFEAADHRSNVAEICRRLDDLPLAIELAAARVRALPVAKIAERLDDRFRMLTGGDRTAMARQQTLRASIDWSWELLSAPERILMRRLAVFAGGWTLEAAEAVGGGGEVEQSQSILELLGGLVEKSLVAIDVRTYRYHFLETVREYALEQLEESGEGAAIRSRHLEWLLDFASRARMEIVGAEQARWMARIDQERENILAGHAWSATRPGNEDLALRLLSALKIYWIDRGLLRMVRGMLLDCVARTPPHSRSRGRGLFVSGQLAYFMGQFHAARVELEEALATARGNADKVAMGQVLQPLGLACLGEGDYAAARPYLEEALALAREGEEPRNVAAAVNALAQMHRTAGNLEEAEPLYGHVVELAREMEDGQLEAIGLLNLAMTAVDLQHVANARESLGCALRIVRSTESRALGQSVLEVCAGLAALEGDWQRAAGFYGAAEAEAARTGLRRDPADEAFLAPHVARMRDALGAGFGPAESGGRAMEFGNALQGAADWLEPRVSS